MDHQQPSAHHCTSWHDLPLELIIQIANALPVCDALALGATTSLYHSVVTDIACAKRLKSPRKGARLLLWTIEHNVLRTTHRLLRLGAATNLANHRIETAELHFRSSMALMKAVEMKNHAVVELLLQHGADVLTQTEEDTTLTLAVRLGFLGIAAQLLEHAAAVDARLADGRGTKNRMSAMHHAAKIGHIEALELLLSHGADREARGERRETPLHTAMLHGQSKAAVFLLERDADVTAVDRDGKDALSLALRMGRQCSDDEATQVLDKLVAVWKESTREADGTGLAITSHQAHELLSSGQLPVIKAVLDAGFAADIRTSDDQRTPLWNCVGITVPSQSQGDAMTAGAALLIDSGADVNHAHPQGLFTPMMRAVAAGRDDMLRLLLSRGADISAKDSLGRTTLSHAVVARTSIRSVGTLIDHNRQADGTLSPVMAQHLETTDHAGCTPLLLSLQGTRFCAAEILIREGANVWAKDKRGYSALARAAERHHTTAMALILDKLGMEDASVIDAKGDNDETPLMLAMLRYNYPGVRVLMQHGANVNTLKTFKNAGYCSIHQSGQTPLGIAISRGVVGMARELLEAGASLRLALSVEPTLLKKVRNDAAMVELLEGYSLKELEEELAQKG